MNPGKNYIVQALQDALLESTGIYHATDYQDTHIERPIKRIIADINSALNGLADESEPVSLHGMSEWSAFSTSGINVFGSTASIDEVRKWHHSHGQIEELKTLARHQREEIGKLHAHIQLLEARAEERR